MWAEYLVSAVHRRKPPLCRPTTPSSEADARRRLYGPSSAPNAIERFTHDMASEQLRQHQRLGLQIAGVHHI